MPGGEQPTEPFWSSVLKSAGSGCAATPRGRAEAAEPDRAVIAPKVGSGGATQDAVPSPRLLLAGSRAASKGSLFSARRGVAYGQASRSTDTEPLAETQVLAAELCWQGGRQG